MLRRFVIFAPLLFTCLATFAQVPAPPSPPIPEKVPDHSQESFVVEKLRTVYRFENDGTGRKEVSARIKIQSESGVGQWGQLVTGYSSANERVDIPYVRVLKANGSTSASRSKKKRRFTPITGKSTSPCQVYAQAMNLNTSSSLPRTRHWPRDNSGWSTISRRAEPC